MSKARLAFHSLMYGVWAVLMTALTYVLGAAPLKVLRRKSGRRTFWGITAGISLALFLGQLWMLALAYFSLAVLIGLFCELEELGMGLNVSAFFTLVINTLIGAGAFTFWMSVSGPKWSATLLNGVETVLKPLESYSPGLEVKYFDLMLQLPSVILILWMASIYLAILLDREDQTTRSQLLDFHIPDAAVWIFILALLGKFGGFGNAVIAPTLEAVSANALNVCFMLFFFQGIAVVARGFEKIRLNVIWQTLFMALIVIYLFLFVSVLGLMDYWFDFRARLAKSNEEFERET